MIDKQSPTPTNDQFFDMYIYVLGNGLFITLDNNLLAHMRH